MYIEAFEACRTKFGGSTCIRADAENRKTGKFMCPYNKKTGATIFNDVTIANWADSDCQDYEIGYYRYRGKFFQDLKNWLVEQDEAIVSPHRDLLSWPLSLELMRVYVSHALSNNAVLKPFRCYPWFFPLFPQQSRRAGFQ